MTAKGLPGEVAAEGCRREPAGLPACDIETAHSVPARRRPVTAEHGPGSNESCRANTTPVAQTLQSPSGMDNWNWAPDRSRHSGSRPSERKKRRGRGKSRAALKERTPGKLFAIRQLRTKTLRLVRVGAASNVGSAAPETWPVVRFASYRHGEDRAKPVPGRSRLVKQ